MEDSAGETSDAVKKGVEEDPPAEGQADAAHTNSSTTDYGQNLNVIGSEASENKNVPIKDVPIGAVSFYDVSNPSRTLILALVVVENQAHPPG